MKIKIWAVPLACLAVFMMFAGSAPAQEDNEVPPNPRLQKILDDFRSPSDSNRAASAGRTSQQQASEAVTTETSACAYPFTSGSGNSYLQYCVTVNGNIVEFQSPVNVEQIRQGTIGEGYGICDLSTSTRYFDYSDSGDSGNWNAPVLQMQTATLVKIARTTTDGLWTLTQTITNSPGPNPYAKVLMQLKNNSAIGKAAYLFRWVDVDPGNPAETDSDFNESLDATFGSAFGWVALNETGSSGSNAPSFGLMFQGVGNPTPASVPYGRNGYSLIGAGPDPCNPAAAYQSPINLTDGTFEYLWFVELTKGQSVSVTGKYFSF